MTAVQLCILAQMEDRTLSLLREGLGTGEGLTIEAAGQIALRQESIEIMPQLRRALWQDALAGIPEEGVQLDYLARQFELSGAQIKNIALNAAYRAAADGGVLHMVHLVQAIFQEFHKEGKVMLSSDFGEYGIMLSDYLSGEYQ